MELPNDATSLEIEIFNYLRTGLYEPQSTAYFFSKIDDPMDKFIALYIYELGKTQKECEIATGLCKTTIWKRLKNIKNLLLKRYQSEHLLKQIGKIKL